MKKILSIFLALTIIFSGMAHFSLLPDGGLGIISFAAEEDGLVYALNYGKESYRVVSCDKNIGSVVIPDTYNGLPVTAIGDEVFSFCSSLSTVVIGNNVERIGYRAFYKNTNLTTIKIPSSVKYIEKDAFAETKNIKRIEIDDIGKWCEIDFLNHYSNPLVYCYNSFAHYGRLSYLYMDGKPVTDIVIPEGVERVGYAAFTNYMHITSITFPSTLKTVEEDAFYGIEQNITGVYVDSLEHWLQIDFQSINANPLHRNANPKCNCDLYVNNKPVSEIVIPESITEIKKYAFYGCTDLEKVTFHDNIERIGEKAFSYCGFYENLDNYENGALYVNNILVAIDKLEVMGEFEVKNGTYLFAEDTFNQATEISYVFLPDTVTQIPNGAFEGCTNLAGVTLGKNTTSIGDRAFYGCSNFSGLEFAEKLEKIGSHAFSGCVSLETFEFPKTLSYLGDSAFYNTGLTELKLDGIDEIKEYTFSHCAALKKIELNNIEKVGKFAFSNCTALELAELNNVKEIGVQAFAYCKKLSVANFSGDVKIIGENAFSGAESLCEVKLPDTVEIIDDYAFYNVSSLNVITWPKSLIYIGNYAFRGCEGLQSVRIGENVEYIGDYAFDECYGLQSIYLLSDSLTKVGILPFIDCNNVKYLYIGAEESIKGSIMTFNNLEEVVFANGINTIKSYGCVNGKMKTVNIPASVKVIEDSAFSSCDNITTVYYGGSPNMWNSISIEANNESILNAEIIYAQHDPNFPDEWMLEYAPTCTQNGSEYRICLDCEDVISHISYRVIPAKGHNATDWIIDAAATVNAPGSKHKECTECGEVIETEVIPQLKLETPKLTKIVNTASGVQVTWGAVEGADSYVVYRKTYNASTKKWSGWSKLATGVTSVSYIDKTSKSGTYYLYTVRAENEAGLSGYDASGIKTYFLATPKVTSTANTNNAITVKWGKVTGATGYIVYRKTTGGWTNLGKAKGTAFTDKTAKSGVTYRYTVRAYYGSYLSSFVSNGYAVRRLTTPTLKSVSSTKAGVTVKWGKVTGATGYIVYRKTGNGSWQNLGKTTSTAFTDKTAKKGVTYTYTVRAYYGTSTSAYNTKGLTIKDKY